MLRRLLAGLLMLIAVLALCQGGFAQAPANNTEQRRQYAEFVAKRRQLVAEADAASDRETAREKAGDCLGTTTTHDINRCYAKAVEDTKANLKAYVSALRAIFALNPGDDQPSSDPTGTPPTTEAFLKMFDEVETKWDAYRESLCSAAYKQWQGGTIAPSMGMECELQAMRNHLRDLGNTLGGNLHQ